MCLEVIFNEPKHMILKHNFNYNSTFSTVRFFSTSKHFFIDENDKDKNDQDKLMQQVEELSYEWTGLDTKIGELCTKIREEEKEFEVEDSDGEDLGETEVSKYVTKREEQKDDIVGSYEEKRNEALFDRKNPREDSSLLLDYINKTTEEDIKTLEAIERNTSGAEDYSDELVETLAELKSHQEKAEKLYAEFHRNDLPPILPKESPSNEESPSRKSSIIDDFANPNTEMPSYIDPED